MKERRFSKQWFEKGFEWVLKFTFGFMGFSLLAALLYLVIFDMVCFVLDVLGL